MSKRRYCRCTSEADRICHKCHEPLCRTCEQEGFCECDPNAEHGSKKSPTLEALLSQKNLTREAVDAQFCSDWLKDEIRILFQDLGRLRREKVVLVESLKRIAGTSPRPMCEDDEAADLYESIARAALLAVGEAPA